MLPSGSPVRLAGIVTADARVFDSHGRKFYMQDSSGGIAVFAAGGDLRVREGDQVSVTGTLAAFNSELQLTLASTSAVHVTGTGAPITPVQRRTGEITVSQYGDLATVQGGVIARQGTAIWLDDGTGSIQALVIPPGINPLPAAGDAVSITGITSRSKGTLQILPRRQGDLTVLGRWPDPEQPSPAPSWPLSTRPEAGQLKLTAVYPHTYESRAGERAEAIGVENTGDRAVDVTSWRLSDATHVAVFPPGTVLAPGERVWVTGDAARFALEFGYAPDLSWGAGGSGAPDAPAQMEGGGLRFSNFGGTAALLDPEGAGVDVFVYGLGRLPQSGWNGVAVQPYLFDTFVPPAGQVFQRKLDQHTGRPLPDTNTAADWLQDTDDAEHGRRLLYAGWSLGPFFYPAAGVEPATTQLLLGPDHLYEATAALIDSAREQIDIEVYTFSNPYLLDRLLARQRDGVVVRALFDGGVYNAPDGSYEEDRWVAQQIVRAGGRAWFWSDAPDERIAARFNNHHQKFLIVDGRRALIATENFEQSSMPAGPKGNGTAGNRGTGVITDAPGVVARLQAIFEHDANPARPDIQPVALDRIYRAPVRRADQSGYSVQRPSPLTLTGPLTYELIQAPESSLRTVDSLIGMVRRAGAGDSVLVQQQYEHLTWGGGRPNPRLQAYLAAARRGARVLVLLDAVNDAGPNQRTVDWLRDTARREGLALDARLGRPAGGPIHNKMVLVTGDAEGWVHISSINGSENSSVFNREVGIQLGSIDAYRYFAQVFASDWHAAGGLLAVDTRSPSAPAAALHPVVTSGMLTLTARCICEFAIDADPSAGAAQPVDGVAAVNTQTLADGGHILYVRQQDGAGVWGPLTALPFTVSRSPPALDIGFDPNRRMVTLVPSGPHSATAVIAPEQVRAGRHEYVMRDASADELRVVLDSELQAERAVVRVVGIAAGDGPVVPVSGSYLRIDFSEGAGLTTLDSEAVTPDESITAAYDAIANQTRIGGTVRPGPRAPELRVSREGVTIVVGR